jgi:hypothetical protein
MNVLGLGFRIKRGAYNNILALGFRLWDLERYLYECDGFKF